MMKSNPEIGRKCIDQEIFTSSFIPAATVRHYRPSASWIGQTHLSGLAYPLGCQRYVNANVKWILYCTVHPRQ